MDALSQLVELAGLRASLDLRCQFADAYDIDHPRAPQGEILFHFVLQGSCQIEMEDGSMVEMRAGDFVALPQGAAHRVRSVVRAAALAPIVAEDDGVLPMRRNTSGPAELDLLCGRFTHQSKVADALFAGLPGALHSSLAEADAELSALVALIRREVEAERPGALAIVASLANVMFALALRAQAGLDQKLPGLIRLVSDPRLARATHAMLQDPGRDWTLDQLAEKAAMGRATFARHFVQVAELTPGDFLLLLRLTRAASLLKQTRRSVGDIGVEVGYQSEAAFNRAFKKGMGASPAAFRRGA
ncbi:MAG TPA: AraC family transcriptional regulator [Burkholderiaceae bacterium]|jgi:AraC family transcriptional activator of mtrCDE